MGINARYLGIMATLERHEGMFRCMSASHGSMCMTMVSSILHMNECIGGARNCIVDAKC